MLEMARPDPQDRPSANEVSSQGTDKAGRGERENLDRKAEM